MSPWQVLGLPHATTDRAAIRRAYAQRIREHPPEDDPQGFRQVRDAYQWLLHVSDLVARGAKVEFEEPGPATAPETAASPNAGTTPATAAEPGLVPGPSPATPRDSPPSPTPDAIAAREAEARAEAEDARRRLLVDHGALLAPLAQAAALPDGSERDAALVAALKDVTRTVVARPDLADAWRRACWAWFFDRTDLMAAGVGDDEWLRAAEWGAFAECEAILTALVLARRWDRIERFAARLAEVHEARREDLDREDGRARLLVTTAQAIAVISPKTARRLLDEAFRVASVEERRSLPFDHAEMMRRVGDEVGGWSRTAAGFLATVALRCEWDGDATRPDAKEAMKKIAALPRGDALRQWLSREVPSLVEKADKAYPGLRRLPAPSVAERLGERATTRPQRTWPGVLPFVIAAVVVFGWIGKSLRPAPPPARPPSLEIDRMLENLRRMRERTDDRSLEESRKRLEEALARRREERDEAETGAPPEADRDVRSGDVRIGVVGVGGSWTGTLRSETAAVGDVPRTIGLRFDDRGMATARGLVPGRYSLWVPNPGGGTGILWRTGLRLSPDDFLYLTLEDGVPVRIHVLWPGGGEAVRTRVTVIGPLGIASSAVKVASGHYVVWALPPGTWTAQAFATFGDRTLGGEAAAEAGGPEVTIRPK